jgi:uncharacterized repeat protein (TIGR01451 family)
MNNFSISHKALPASNQQGKHQARIQGAAASVRHVLSLVCLVGAGLFSANTFAEGAAAAVASQVKAPIAINLQQFKVVKDDQGKTKLVDAALVLPGDVIEYRAVYSNRSGSALPVVATMPIPESMEYIKDSAKTNGKAAHTVAAKDAQYAQEPLQQKVTTASGATLSQPVPYASYRFVRWDLGRLPSGSSVEVSVRTKVSEDLEKDATAADKTPVQVSSSDNK